MESSKALWKLVAITLVAFCLAAVKVYAAPQPYSFLPAYEELTDSQKIGKEIWYKSTAGNSRFHTYVFLQRMGVAIDWYKVLKAEERYERFNTWGLMNEPGCCTPGEKDCPATSLEQTYGMDWCPGDGRPWAGEEGLLSFVGKKGYQDPACNLPDVPGRNDRQSACDLEFGTSTGAVGFRKFPNPRFNVTQWLRINGGKLGTWAGYNKKIQDSAKREDERMSHIHDGSIEPPFLIGTTCASCHVSFNPLKPPQDPARPTWENLDGTVGAQYLRISEVLGSGMARNSFEWQNFTHARPGATDTSAVPNDFVTNPGTINPIFNFDRKTKFDHDYTGWFAAARPCAPGANEATCWCEPGKPNKCWEKRPAVGEERKVLHVLKGGEDSIGPAGAVQRVYINIGSCAEQCWLNHLVDFKQLDPNGRNYGQTPFDIGQCRRDCPNFRAIEDRVGDIAAFLFSRRPTDLYVAKGYRRPQQLVSHIEEERPVGEQRGYGKGSVARGRAVFAQTCARCHSNHPDGLASGSFRDVNFLQTENDDPNGVRLDWLGNDEPTTATSVLTYRGRALHSNHNKGHIWEQYASETHRSATYRPRVADLKDPNEQGQGYYKNPSLLSVWAFAPFMHNNAIGPEVCGDAKKEENQYYRSPYPAGQPAPDCWKYDPSIEGRLKLFEASMDQLLNPEKRIKKVTLTDREVVRDLTPKMWFGNPFVPPLAVSIVLPKGIPTTLLGSFDYKKFLLDLIRVAKDPAAVEADLAKDPRVGPELAKKLVNDMKITVRTIATSATKQIRPNMARLNFYMQAYSNNTADDEAAGHLFGTRELTPQNKKDLTAFLMTL